jgi:hypothetical protein
MLGIERKFHLRFAFRIRRGIFPLADGSTRSLYQDRVSAQGSHGVHISLRRNSDLEPDHASNVSLPKRQRVSGILFINKLPWSLVLGQDARAEGQDDGQTEHGADCPRTKAARRPSRSICSVLQKKTPRTNRFPLVRPCQDVMSGSPDPARLPMYLLTSSTLFKRIQPGRTNPLARRGGSAFGSSLRDNRLHPALVESHLD